MACFAPLTGYQDRSGAIKFSMPRDYHRTMLIPCGQCIGCKVDRASAWAIRCQHEALMHQQSCFVTLTYSDEHLPSDGSLNYRDFQLFMKRLRKEQGKVRFFMCGEYGEKLQRPHYHACLFGYMPNDSVLFKSRSGYDLYTSPTLTRLWGLGHVSFGEVNGESAGYCARYTTKKINGPTAPAHYMSLNPLTGELSQLTPEFGRMSLKPGIGSTWFEKYGSSDIYNSTDEVIINGKKKRPPKYYDKKQALKNPVQMTKIKTIRTNRAATESNYLNSSRERLAARKTCLEAKLNRSIRQL